MNYDQIRINGEDLIERTIKLWLTGHPGRDLPNRPLCEYLPVKHIITKRVIQSQIYVRLANGNGTLAVYKWSKLDKKTPLVVAMNRLRKEIEQGEK
jgi:hypothetical protein